jgi:hypothetical protein
MTRMAVQTPESNRSTVDFIDLPVVVRQRIVPRAQTCPRGATGKYDNS